MTTIRTVTASIAIPASQSAVFKAVTDWELQTKWILATKVTGVSNDSRRLGGKLEAFTGFGRIGILDTMTITKWEPPRLCEVTHTGKFVKGSGVFAVTVVDDITYFSWTERSIIPFGFIGAIGWIVVKPFAKLALKVSLMRFRTLLLKNNSR